MTPQELKNSILQLAIQGKLVEQRPEEGTGEELYQQIQAEKQRLIKAGTIKIDKPLPEITEDEKAFDIPESWKWVQLGDIYKLLMGQSPDGESVSESTLGIEFHQGKVFFGEDYLQKSNQTTNKPTKIAEPYSVLLCVRAPVGIVNITEREICIGRGLCAVSTYAGMDTKYVLYALRSYKTDFIKKATGTTFVAITAEVVRSQVVPLPPLAEQRRIVAKIEELLPYIDRYEQAWSKLEDFNRRFPGDMQKSILQTAIQGKLVEQRPEEGTGEELYQQIQDIFVQEESGKRKVVGKNAILDIPEDDLPFEIPESWKWVRLGKIGYTNIGLTYSPQNQTSDGTIVLRSSNIQDGQMDYEDIVRVNMDIPENKMCQIGDILICARNGSKRLVGKSAIVDQEGMSFGAFMAIFRSICNQYVLHVINSAYFRNSLLGDTGTTTINQITQDMLKNALIPLPPLTEQKRIVARLEEILPLCERLKR